ncbi:MAG: cytochrome c3 family protein [Desulfobulbaceae bacterium]|nr:cytochrome c3 family protein [Desulfobulbaceae bacterium]
MMTTAKTSVLFVFLVEILTPAITFAVTGVCANCHVMHASVQSVLTPTAGPQSYLMRNTCLGCHTQTGGGSGAPYVYGATTDLAGGDFDYASGAFPTNGHNPVGIGAAAVVTPPGWKVSTDFDDNGQVGGATAGSSWASQLTCDGVWGCHGLHTPTGIKGAHHNNQTGPATTIDGTTLGKSYRFLYGIRSGEAADYEEAAAATNHNVYIGANRVSGASDTASTTGSRTMSYFCAECHGIFHSGSSATEGLSASTIGSPWIRHPVDFSMPAPSTVDSVNYYNYTTYNPVIPLATSDTSTATTDSDVTASPTTDRIVMCLSCHRAHASPYYASMRWDYRGTNGVTGANSCATCHTDKN